MYTFIIHVAMQMQDMCVMAIEAVTQKDVGILVMMVEPIATGAIALYVTGPGNGPSGHKIHLILQW